MCLLDEMQLPHFFKWGNSGRLSRFISVLSKFFEIGCIEPASAIWSWADADIRPSLKRFIFPLCEFSWDWQTHKHIEGLLLEGSVPLNCYVWLLALCLFIAIVKPLACVPHLYKTYTKTFLKGFVRGLWRHDNSSNIIDFFPLRRPYHVLRISVARSPRRPFWLTTLGFWHRETAQCLIAEHWSLWTGNCDVKLITRFVKAQNCKADMYENQINWLIDFTHDTIFALSYGQRYKMTSHMVE